MNENVFISIVSPVYMAEFTVEELIRQIKNSLREIGVDYEIILVDDGSPDHSWQLIEKSCDADEKIKGIKLSKNFGQHYAITAGLANASGDWVVVLDCDLQDDPKEIINLYRHVQEGYDMVLARRVDRQDGFFKKMTSKVFYSVFGYLTGTKQDATIANYGIYHKKVIKAILSMKDKVRYFPTMAQWVGFSVKYLDVNHNERASGKSSYTLKSLVNLALNNIVAFSSKPLLLTIRLGLVISTISFLLGAYYFILYLNGGITEPGFPSVIISVWFIGWCVYR